tara:strand:+ start:161 stop:301 length:141 start_codon:yes stop_codon:yes gene_type:complete
MKVGDLVRVSYDGTMGVIVRIEDDAWPWIYLHTGECFKWEMLEVIA